MINKEWMEMNEQNEHDDVESLDDNNAALDDGDLLEEMVRAFVAEPNVVKVSTTHDGECKVLTVSVADDDRGKVIGKQGRVHKIINDFFGVVGFRNGYPIRVMIEGDTNFYRKNPGIAQPRQYAPPPPPPAYYPSYPSPYPPQQVYQQGPEIRQYRSRRPR